MDSTTPILLWYGHAPAGTPQRPVLGLALVRRAVLSAQDAGFRRIVVAVRETDLPVVRAGLHGDPRIDADLTVLEAPADASGAVEHLLPGGTGELVVALGDRVWAPGALDPLLVPLPPGLAARLLRADPGAGRGDEPSGLARVRAGRLAGLPLRRDLDPDDAVAALGGPEHVELADVVSSWLPVRRPDDVLPAETFLMESPALPPRGVLASHAVHPLVAPLSRRLARRRAPPGAFLLLALALGVGSGPLAWGGTRPGYVAAAACLAVACLLRALAGELARLGHLAAPRFARLHALVADALALSFFAGLFHGLDRGAGRVPWGTIGLGVLGACGVATLVRHLRLGTRRCGGTSSGQA
ncbi:MAG: hypothetical protein HY905_25985 [Deltaproteobacteria bacterium]|nr:hypothetical protein [Deltaproteobacteria bacterium]